MYFHLTRLSSLFILFFLLSQNISAQFVNFEDTWTEFLADSKTSNISQLVKPSKDQTENYAKYCLMYANDHFCADEINNSEELMAEVRKIGEPMYSTIEGFKEKFVDLEGKIKAYHAVDKVWKIFLKNGTVAMSDLNIENGGRVCEKGTLAKFSYMKYWAHYCDAEVGKAKDMFEKRVLKLAEHTTLEIKDVEGLAPKVTATKELFAGLKELGPAWKEFIETDESPGFETDFPLMECYSIPTMKVYMLRAATDVCKNGSEMLEKINKLKKTNTHKIPEDLAAKIKWLEKESGNFTGDMAKLEAAWKEFVPTDTLNKGTAGLTGEYCHKDAQIKAYTMIGTIEACDKGAQMLKNIADVQEEFEPELDDTTLEKIKNLEAKLKDYEADIEALNTTWKEFIDGEDTLTGPYELKNFYCDKIAQVKSWAIKGHMSPCDKGKGYLTQIDKLKKKNKLEFDDELACRVLRLEGKVYQCRYIELVKQAHKETHAEREAFGPKSAAIMQAALNSDKLPCETLARYTPLGNIGVKYIISTFMCQNIDLAKMGDPEYYRKIATWVDSEVLQKYCEESMRCKEKFYIYLEGHTDGHAFKGATYKRSLDIPAGTYYTHFLNGMATDKSTPSAITTSLRSNMELGLARAWTVKQQLDFMKVPISIGAYEHPASEKGGEYRRVEIELNITNLLLDFFEKRLAALIKESGIGERPKEC